MGWWRGGSCASWASPTTRSTGGSQRAGSLHRGVYAVGHRALAFGAHHQAALLAAGPDSAVEVDGRAFHDVVATAEADRARDDALALAGFLVLRFT